MSDSEQTDGGFDAQKLAEEREKTSLSSNPLLLGKYVGSVFAFVLIFVILGATLNFRILPIQYPAFGILTFGVIVGLAFIHERSLSLPKRLLSMVGYLVSAYFGMGIFPMFLPRRMRFSVFAITLILSGIAGGFVWYYLRNETLTDFFE